MTGSMINWSPARQPRVRARVPIMAGITALPMFPPRLNIPIKKPGRVLKTSETSAVAVG